MVLPLLRKLRKKLISESKTSQYAIYAIGEVVLVVVGILLALQINNWSEDIKDRKYELTMLRELKSALDSDVKAIEDIIPYADAVKVSLGEIVKLKNDRTLPKDSLKFHLDRVLEFGCVLTVNTSAYDAIKSGGLDRISNQKIRRMISELYGYKLEAAETWINVVLRKELFERMDLMTELFDLNMYANANGDIVYKVLFDDPNIVHDNPLFEKMIFVAEWPLPNTLKLLAEMEQDMQALSKLISEEVGDN